MKNFFKSYFSLLILVLLFTGCEEIKKDQEIKIQGNMPSLAETLQASSFSASETLQRLAKYLPKDSIFFGTLNLEQIFGSVDPYSILGKNFSPEMQKAFQDELSSFLKERTEIDPTQLKWAAFAVNLEKTSVLIASGNFYDAKSLKKVEIEGLHFFELESGAFIHPLAEKNLSVIAMNREMAEEFAKISKDPSLTLAKNPARKEYLSSALSSLSSTSFISAVLDTTHPRLRVELKKLGDKIDATSLNEINHVALSLGMKLELKIQGSEKVVADLKKLYEMGRGLASENIRKFHSKIRSLDTQQGVLAIFAFHLLEPTFETFKPEFSGENAKLEIDLSTLNGGVFLLYVSGFLAAVGAPIYMSFMEDAQKSEASIYLNWAADGAESYFNKSVDLSKQGSATLGSNHYPKATSTDWLGCTTTGNQLGEASQPNAEDFTKSPWKELKFSIEKPHYYRYCYRSTGDTFTITATASLSTPNDSIFSIKGSSRLGTPIIGTIQEQ